MRPDDERYFERIESRLDEAFDRAERAKARGHDPEPEVEIPVAKDMADRVENILGIAGVAARVRELEGQMSREEAALELVTDFVEGSVGDYDSREGKVEGAVRTAVALLTEGVVAAPIEGIDRVEILENDDGTEFVNVYYAGPIRSAGGTAQALSVLVADYARSLLGIEEYAARSIEVERYAEEVALYDKETGLQYSPKDKETKFIAEHMPIMLDGEATGDEEVSGFRDLERVDTNSARGGMCLVLAEGIALKAPKIQRYTRGLDEVDWPWLQDLIDGTVGEDTESAGSDGEGADGSSGEDGSEESSPDGDSGDGAATESDDSAEDEDDAPAGPPRLDPSTKYLRDLIAGRPVFGHPSAEGSFRLRYGRSRNHGFATAGVHPATMHLVDDFLATGTQIKTERPGKAAGVIPVDSIEGPTVRLANGDVRRIDDPEEALEVRNGVEKIIDLGEYLVNFGEFVENNHPLAPASYVYEWWIQEFEAAGAPVQALDDDPGVDLEHPTPSEAHEWATAYDCPLHPDYTYLWHDISVAQFEALADAVEAGEVRAAETDGGLSGADGRAARDAGMGRDESPADVGGVLELPETDAIAETLEHLLVEHQRREGTIRVPEWRLLVRSLGFAVGDEARSLDRTWRADGLSARARGWDDGESALVAANEVAPFELRERAPTRVGNRMGRPEKSESRDLSPAVHTLFPIGEAGGSQRDVGDAARLLDDQGRRGVVDVRVGDRHCPDCDTHTYRTTCPECGTHTEPYYECDDCGRVVEPDESGRVYCERCEREVTSPDWFSVDVGEEYRQALEAVGERESAYDIMKGVKGLTSADKTPEPMAKGVLRAKNGVTSFKDGTVRYDMTDLPVTAVRPAELDVTAADFRELGYETDIDGEPLEFDDQLVELKVQDIVLSDGAAEHMLKTADFVDDLLAQFYDLPPFYEVDEREELVGELVFGMAPHTSAAVVGRVVGFTSAAVGYAHPYFHAAKRRNCFHPETKVWYRDEAENWHHEQICDLVEPRLDDPTEDDFGTLVQELDGDVYVPSIDEDGTETIQPVDAVSKHVSPDHLVRVETQRGREITVTPDHRLCRWSDGVERIEASSVTPGDDLPLPSDPAFRGGQRAAKPSPTRADGGVATDAVEAVEYVESDVEYTYCLTVEGTHTLVSNSVYTGQCDGDEDCVMLLMDGLLNFSKDYLPDKRGGQMDAPLVMSSRIDPSEIDDEAHNMDIVRQYPREFYEATRELADPGEVEELIRLGEDTLGTDDEYRGFDHTHDTSDIALGPDLSAYKTLGSMMDKMDAQLELSRKLRAVDETDVAERVIEYHFLPDLIGNLRAFSRQETRCLDCGEKYRRMPLTGDCRECGGRVNLTVHQGSVNKYMDTAIHVAEEFGCREYTKQRLEVLEKSLESVFENDKNRPTSLGDFM
ncbi:DNA-directed DNA polymerase II large subunit [Halobellus sp. Atlit-31R]|nr:DNA-directed DNA polymerase II large subunit [Halobellus sp. Atlit-31R]